MRIHLVCLGLGLGSLGSALPALALPDHQDFDLVLGQIRPDASQPNLVDERGLYAPRALAVDRSRVPSPAYLSDANNSRVLCWRDVARLRAGDPPDVILGQPDATLGQASRRDAQAIAGPTGLAVDPAGTLWIADQSNGRIVGYRWPFGPRPVTPDFLIGQPDFTVGYYQQACNGGFLFNGAAGTPSAERLCRPQHLATDSAGTLYVADQANHRVLLFQAPIPPRGARAAGLLGQERFEDRACNRGLGAASELTLCSPGGLAVSQESGGPIRLYVTDALSNRVLLYEDPMRNPAAVRVFGQPSLKVGTPSRDAGGMTNPGAVSVAPSGAVWIADTFNHRVYGYAPPFTGAAGFAPTYVLGQASTGGSQINRGAIAPGAGTLNGPGGMIWTDGGLLLLDTSNHRLLRFERPEAIGPDAAAVIGQEGFARSGANRVKGHGMLHPVAVAVDNSGPQRRLYVADLGNSRVLGYRDLATLRSGQPADLILGQGDPLDGHCNRGGAPSERTLCHPRGLVVDARGDLWVSDGWNHRVLRFPAPFSQGGDPRADLVLGQVDLSGGQANRGAGKDAAGLGLYTPMGLTTDEAGRIWVADRDNDRVLGYGPPPFTSGMAASRVLAVTTPNDVAVDAAGDLWVAEQDRHRVARYRGAPAVAGGIDLAPDPLAVLGQKAAVDASPNQGQAAPTASTLHTPISVAIEQGLDNGRRVDRAIVVADAGNRRVLVYPPVREGLGIAATQVFGQDGRFDRAEINLGTTPVGDPEGLRRGLAQPAGVRATSEGLFITESGPNALLSVKTRPDRSPADPGGVSNHRVLVIKGPGYPPPPMMTMPEVPVDGGADGGVAPDMAAGPGPGGGCQHTPGTTGPAWLGLLALLGLRRRAGTRPSGAPAGRQKAGRRLPRGSRCAAAGSSRLPR